MNTDSVKIPVEIGLPASDAAIEAAIKKLEARLRASFSKAAVESVNQNLPARPTVTGTERFRRGDREFEVRGRVSAQTTPTLVTIDEAGRESTDALERFAVEIREVKQKLSKTIDADTVRLKDFKKSIRHHSDDVQQKAIQDFITQYGDINNELRSRLGKIKQRGSKRELGGWSRRMLAADPSAALAEIEKSLSDRTFQFVEEAKILRERIRRTSKTSQQQAAREKQRNFSNQMMLGAGAGLGLLGNAGFPLLNIGFAAMSGGTPTTVGLVALATAVGVVTRAIESLSVSTQAAAREIGFVPTSLKMSEARNKSLEAFVGLGGLNARQVELERRLKDFKELSGTGMELNEKWNNIWGSGRRRLGKTLTQDEGVVDRFLNSTGGGITGWIREFVSQNKETIAKRPEALESAFRNTQLEMMKPTVGIENDPYEIWKRIQNSALDPTKAEEMQIMREGLKTLKEMVDIQRNRIWQDDQLKGMKPSQGFLGGGGMGGVW